MGDMCGSKPPSAKAPRISAQPVTSEWGSDQVLSHVDDAVSPSDAAVVVSEEQAKKDVSWREDCFSAENWLGAEPRHTLNGEPIHENWLGVDLWAQPVVSHLDVGLDSTSSRAAELLDEQLAAAESKTTVSPPRGVCPGDRSDDPGWAPSPEDDLSHGPVEEEIVPELSETELQTAAEFSAEQLAAAESKTTVSPPRRVCPGVRADDPGWAPSPKAELSPGPGDEDAAPGRSAGKRRSDALSDHTRVGDPEATMSRTAWGTLSISSI